MMQPAEQIVHRHPHNRRAGHCLLQRRRLLSGISLALLLVAVSDVAWGQSGKKAATSDSPAAWPQFLGPDRNGISREAGLIADWPADGPPEVWRTAGGQGMSGLAISAGRLLTLVQKSGRQWVVCHDSKTGASNWELDLAPAYRNPMGDGPRGTPAISGDIACVFTGEGILAAINVTAGRVVWKKDVLEELGGKPAEYGMACSPLMIGDLVVVVLGAPEAAVAAFQIKTGDIAWKAGGNVPAGYSSPALLNVGGREQLVVVHGAGGLGVNPKTGAELWTFPYTTDFNCNIATPLAVDGGVFLSAGENHGSVLLSLKTKGEKFEPVPVWESHGPASVMRNEWQTSILLDGYLYGFDNVGGAGPITHFNCVNAATGKRQWQQVRFGKGNMIAADGKLFVSTVLGELVVIQANSRKFEELGRKMVVGKTRQAPVIAGGLLYLRDDHEIVCLDVRKR